ncbi:VWA domain-containing protein [Phycisphaeraceae bacterium D3-23]
MMLFGFAANRASAPGPDHVPPPNEFEEEFDDEDSIGDEISDTLVALMPWGISILLHVGLVVAAFFFVWQVIMTEEPDPPVIPDAAFSETPGSPDPIETVDEQTSDAPPTVPTIDPTTNPPSPVMNVTDIQSLSVGATSAGGTPGSSFTSGNGTGTFGTNVFGNGGTARNIAFIVDASGSMVDTMPLVINELKRVINELDAAQKFTIIFFNGEGVFEVPGTSATGRNNLRAATAEFKQFTSNWITLDNHNIEPNGRGSVNAIPAIELALKYDPQLVFLLSDNLTGGGQGATTHEIFQTDVMRAIERANDNTPPAKINTIQFLYRDPLLDAGLSGTLERIAEETEGNYKFLSERDLNLR